MNFNEYFKQKQSKFVDIEQLPLTKSVTAFIQFDCICALEPGWAARLAGQLRGDKKMSGDREMSQISQFYIEKWKPMGEQTITFKKCSNTIEQ